MTKQEIIDLVESSGEFEFDYDGIHSNKLYFHYDGEIDLYIPLESDLKTVLNLMFDVIRKDAEQTKQLEIRSKIYDMLYL